MRIASAGGLIASDGGAAPSFGRPALFHDKESRGALAYLALAGEMIRREDEAFAARAREALARDSAFAAAAGTSPPAR